MLTITKDKLLKLKSGTDIRGVAVETEKEAVELTDEVVTAVAAAFVQWYKKKFGKENIKIAVGHDSRISAERIKKAAINAFVAEGVTVYDCGLSSTPAMFMSIVLDIKADAALEITASHHPYQRNGLKFFTENGGLEEDVCNNIVIPWNDIPALERVIEENKNEIAALIAQPYDHGNFYDNSFPAEGFWKKVREICTKNEIVLIIDDVRAGFRLDLAGSDHFFGFEAAFLAVAVFAAEVFFAVVLAAGFLADAFLAAGLAAGFSLPSSYFASSVCKRAISLSLYTISL